MKNVLLVILDGFGYSKSKDKNAIENANTPYIDHLFNSYTNTLIKTSGNSVGLPVGQMGNSEVGHINIGAGRIVYQDSTRISKSIETGDFFDYEVFEKAFEDAKYNKNKVHFIGLLSDGGVHSDQTHLTALLKLAKKYNHKETYIHCFLDGRDTPPNSSLKYINILKQDIDSIGIGKIASVSGRYYAMDRDNRWDRIQKAYNAMIGKTPTDVDVENYIKSKYVENIFDEFIDPVYFSKSNGNIEKGDVVINFNFRADRAKEITKVFVNNPFTEFERDYLESYYIQFTNYDQSFNIPTVFDQIELKNTLPEYLAINHIKQLRCAETEKYAHVTFFLNGGVDEIYDGEERILVKSPDVKTYDLKPEMSAFEVTSKLIDAIQSQKFPFIAVNYANSDMVGHTGNYEAAVKAIEALDQCLNDLIPIAQKNNYDVLITADHGNAEKMYDFENNVAFTQHTTGPVPLIYISDHKFELKSDGALQDIAPTVLDIMNLSKPDEMTGQSLIKRG